MRTRTIILSDNQIRVIVRALSTCQENSVPSLRAAGVAIEDTDELDFEASMPLFLVGMFNDVLQSDLPNGTEYGFVL